MFKSIFILNIFIFTSMANAQVSPIGELIQRGLEAARQGPQVMSCWDDVVAYSTEARRCRDQAVPAMVRVY